METRPFAGLEDRRGSGRASAPAGQELEQPVQFVFRAEIDLDAPAGPASNDPDFRTQSEAHAILRCAGMNVGSRSYCTGAVAADFTRFRRSELLHQDFRLTDREAPRNHFACAVTLGGRVREREE